MIERDERELTCIVVREYSGEELIAGRAGRGGDESFWPIGIPSIHANSFQNVEDGGLNPMGMALGKGKAESKARGFGWWWHTPEDTVDKVDREYLARDTRLYLALAFRLCAQPVLPLDHSAAVTELVQVLDGLQQAAGAKFDLSSCLQQARRLEVLTQELSRAEVAIVFVRRC